MKMMTSPNHGRGKLIQGVLAGLIGAFLAMILYLPGWLDRWEAKTWDWRVSLMAKPSAETDNIRVVLLDQESLEWARTANGLFWPWPREVFVPILQFCERAGVRALVFDMLFDKPSDFGSSDDRALAAAMNNLPVVGGLSLSEDRGAETQWAHNALSSRIYIQDMDEWEKLTGYRSAGYADFPVADLAGAFDMLANLRVSPDPDRVYRRVALAERFDGTAVPAPGLAAYLAANPGVPLSIRPGEFSLDGMTVPIDNRGRAILNFRGAPGTHKAYSAASIIQSELRLQAGLSSPVDHVQDFRDSYVIFSFSAPSLVDYQSSQLSGYSAGPDIHATVLDNLLVGDFMSSAHPWVAVFMTVLLALCAGMAVFAVSGPGRKVLVTAICLLVPVVICLIAYQAGYWFPFLVQETGVVATILSAGIVSIAVQGRQKASVRNAFGQYLSPAVISRLGSQSDSFKVTGERRTLSIMYSNIERFAELSESLDPATLTGLLYRYHTAMTEIIHQEDGTVDKYERGAVVAFWNAPMSQTDHAVRCVRAALRCQERLAELDDVFREMTGGDVATRVGVYTGTAVVGDMGSRTRFDYTVIGDAVNLALELERINEHFGTRVLVSQPTMFELAGAFPAREIGTVIIDDQREPVVLYEPFLPEEMTEERRMLLKKFSEALHSFQAGKFVQSQERFTLLAEDDPVARIYAAKCTELIDNPSINQEDAWTFTTK